ncbi:hypothetical protein A2U01_0085632, partial [Trifolium medium]|nr:hypothetical protein [Trifolium medium]
MTSAADEPESTRGLTTRTELMEKMKKLEEDVFKGAKYSWENALAQLQIV